ncbi:MAG: hypothetical protein GY758_28370 [Fuerstiella sp.]|jgi:hypothetical protein|nr:hypothetical protein [Fuerstiella sp.]MCP4506415.1 hypothetical protein [Fuerstiella sp.]MDG2130066.1 hypothetical protein [Fuerstiella sp.]
MNAGDAQSTPTSFEELAASRRQWIDDVLRPWCRQATQQQLRDAELEWLDIAGRVDVQATLWTWAWERFSVLTHPEMAGVNESHEVQLRLQDGTVVQGFPDSRESIRGTLVLVPCRTEPAAPRLRGPYSVDDVAAVQLVSSPPDA